MHDNDVELRMVRQIEPNVAYKADTLYHRNPVEMERKTKQLEAEQLAIAQAEEAAREIEEKAERAKENVLKLKKRSKYLMQSLIQNCFGSLTLVILIIKRCVI